MVLISFSNRKKPKVKGHSAPKQMKILFVNNFRKRGGGEEFLRELLPGLAAKGITVGLICRPHTPLVDIFKNTAIHLHPVDRNGLNSLSAIFKTARIIRQGGYHIVDIQRGHDIVQVWLGALLSGVKPRLMYTPQVPEFIRSRFLLSRMTRIVTISRYIRDELITYFPAITSRLSIIYYGIDLDKFASERVKSGIVRGRFKLAADVPIIGTVGDTWKNQIEFLEALVLIRRELPGARFALVAEQSMAVHMDKFKQRAAELGLSDALVWTGRLSKEEMLSFYSDIDLAVSTHRNEGFGIWILEALAMGAPVVSINEGGIRDSLEGCPAGILVDGGPDAMAAAVINLLKNRPLRTQMAASGPKWVADRFSRQRMIEDYYRFFEELENG
jgi:glycosyltransferase involved in cell wall biosynthesis